MGQTLLKAKREDELVFAVQGTIDSSTPGEQKGLQSSNCNPLSFLMESEGAYVPETSKLPDPI